MKALFTKGDWTKVQGGSCDSGMLITTISRYGCHQAEICTIDVDFEGDMGVEQLANVFLIEQSLNMYNELESCLEMLKSAHFNTGSIGAKNKVNDLIDLLKKCRGEIK